MQERIIAFLKKTEGYLSGEEISRHLKISRAGIWKYMQELRLGGYEIAAVPHLGYHLVSSPDKLFPCEIQYGLKTKYVGQNIVYRETVTSTMDLAFQLGMEGAEEGRVVCAEGQSKGKGRLGRSWNSPKGKGIYASILLRPPFLPMNAAQLTLTSAVAVCEAVRKSTGVEARIKWPNDLLIKNKKFAGILTEMIAEMDRVRFVIVGIGINVNTPLHSLPEGAVSLKAALGRECPRVGLFREILYCLERRYEELKREGFPSILDEWKRLSSTLGRRVRVVDPSGAVEGEAVDLDKDGGLMIRSDAGITIKRMSGDVVQVR